MRYRPSGRSTVKVPSRALFTTQSIGSSAGAPARSPARHSRAPRARPSCVTNSVVPATPSPRASTTRPLSTLSSARADRTPPAEMVRRTKSERHAFPEPNLMGSPGAVRRRASGRVRAKGALFCTNARREVKFLDPPEILEALERGDDGEAVVDPGPALLGAGGSHLDFDLALFARREDDAVLVLDRVDD